MYDVSTAPCRFLGEQGGELLFDLNHPLAGRELTLSATILSINFLQVERGGRCEAWLEPICNNGPGMQDRSAHGATAFFHGLPFRREDEGPDNHFYRMPQLVQYLNDCALAHRSYGDGEKSWVRPLNKAAAACPSSSMFVASGIRPLPRLAPFARLAVSGSSQ